MSDKDVKEYLIIIYSFIAIALLNKLLLFISFAFIVLGLINVMDVNLTLWICVFFFTIVLLPMISSFAKTLQKVLKEKGFTE